MRNLVCILLLLVSVNLWSEESGFYVGGHAGIAELDDDGMGDNQSLEDNSGTSRIFGGYQFNPYFAAEASYDLLGTYDSETATADITDSYSALMFTLVGRIPLGGGFSLFAQGGGGMASNYQMVDGTIGSVVYDDDDASSSSFATVFGGGLSFLIPKHNAIEVRAGYLQTEFEVDAFAINRLGNLVESEYDQSIKQFYLGAAYHF